MAAEETPVLDQEERQRAINLSEQRLRPPIAVPGYEAETFLGRGAFGEVWLAMERNTGRRVAIKFYTNRGGLDWSLLSREVEKLRFLFGDRHVVQLIEVGWDANPPYYIMEYLEQGSLEQLLDKGLPSVPQAVSLFREVATGLNHAHGKGILHCDLKPANILLDQYLSPRLADFGQARLADEHSAALGTVFYMAPEQADLKAAPDVRWDVYALGALLYRMLTGQPPYRTDQVTKEIHHGASLEERLVRYRQFIHQSPPPAGHRKVSGVDSALAAIVDRCLAKKPDKRFPNVQAVLNALDQRAIRRAKRPLLILGGVGPLLLLLVIFLFAWQGFHIAVEDSYHALTSFALESNQLTARFAAAAVQSRINQRWGILERQASNEELRELVVQARDQHPGNRARKELQRRLDEMFARYQPTATSSAWFLLDARGKMVALSPKTMRDAIVAKKLPALNQSFADRDFFHGTSKEYTEQEAKTNPPKPLQRPYHSRVIASKLARGARRVIFSVPMRDRAGQQTIAVLCMGVDIGKFTELKVINEQNQKQDAPLSEFATLVDTRPDITVTGQKGKAGLILQHPQLERWRKVKNKNAFPDVYLDQGQLNELRQGIKESPAEAAFLRRYRDPFGKADAEFQDRWLAVAKPIVVQRVGGERTKPEQIDTGWLVLVQERHSAIVEPVQKLKSKLLTEGVLALVLTLGVIGGVWGFVFLMMNDSSRSRLARFFRRRAGLPSGAFTTHTSSMSVRSNSLGTGDPGRLGGGMGTTTVTQNQLLGDQEDKPPAS